MHTHMHTHFIPKDKKKRNEENNLKLRVLFLSLLSLLLQKETVARNNHVLDVLQLSFLLFKLQVVI